LYRVLGDEKQDSADALNETFKGIWSLEDFDQPDNSCQKVIKKAI
jgi:hypothetical protein